MITFSHFSYVFIFRRVGGDAFNSMSQPSISRYIEKYTEIMTNNLAHRYIHFPQTQNELAEVKRGFELKFNFPGVIGIVDGTHVQLSALRKEIEHAFVDRKGNHSINVQIVCDSSMLITSINARFPGSTHDAYVFANSRLPILLEAMHRANPNEWNFLIGRF